MYHDFKGVVKIVTVSFSDFLPLLFLHQPVTKNQIPNAGDYCNISMVLGVIGENKKAVSLFVNYKRKWKYRIVTSTNTCYYSENQIFYNLE